jgi:hypothetical protein
VNPIRVAVAGFGVFHDHFHRRDRRRNVVRQIPNRSQIAVRIEQLADIRIGEPCCLP